MLPGKVHSPPGGTVLDQRSPREGDGLPVTRPLVSVVLPTYNERESLPLAVEALRRELGEDGNWEVIVVDDDSPDGTWAVAEEMAARDVRIRVYRRLDRRGLSSAVVAGLSLARADRLVVMDADLQHDVKQVRALAEALDEAPVAVGSRYTGGGGVGAWSRSRVALSRAATVACTLVLGLVVSDPMSGFFMLRRDVLNNTVRKLSGIGFKILLEIIVTHPELRVDEVGFAFAKRVAGESNVSVREAMRYLQHVARLRRRLTLRALRYAVTPG